MSLGFASPSGVPSFGSTASNPGGSFGHINQQTMPTSANDVNKSFSSLNELSGLTEDNILDYLKKTAASDSVSRDKLISYYLNTLAQNSANAYNAQREDTYYQRMVQDLRKAGISPYALSPSGSPISQATAISQSSESYTSQAETAKQLAQAQAKAEQQMAMQGLGTMASFIGTILMFMALAL